ncbi:hypothetical protein [Roseovarius sp.]|uniref:hypothetical protein n=1 Tax=Roseovarius sp. TaxID=1486281 RepID=UPI003BACD4A5
MKLTETISALPIEAEASQRSDVLRCITSGRAGECLPLAYVPMLREDRANGRVRIRVEMEETVFPLLNAVNVTAMAHFVPYLAFERFNGLEHLNRSYKGEPEVDASVTPFIEDMDYDVLHEINYTMGIHARTGSKINSAVVEAYNTLWNFRARARSTKIAQRGKLDTDLAPAFWRNPGMSHIVPDFDQAMIDGEVALQVVNPKLPVKSETRRLSPDNNHQMPSIVDADDNAVPGDANGFRDWGERIFAEMSADGLVVSLANIELAKKTAAFAALRKQYAGVEEDYLIDLLMSGYRIPDLQMSQPILLDRRSTIVGYSQRWATDGANLDQSVTRGETYIDLRMRTPPMNTGGIILITMEIVPEQLFERQQDWFLNNAPNFAPTVDDFPEFVRDYLDPEKVDVVPNSHVDVEHTDPTGTFGYAPLNHVWKRNIPRVGGKFMRQVGDPFVEDRQRIWGVETIDPALVEDFYVVNNLHHNVFADTNADPFEITTLGNVDIVGNTVFGKRLEEDTGDYDVIDSQVDKSRIEQEEE